MSQPKLVAVACHCIVRNLQVLSIASKQPVLTWAGHPADPMAKAVERCNEGKASEVDLIALSAFPVFDYDDDEKADFVMEIL